MTFDEAMVLTRSVSSNAAFEDPECRLMFELVSSLEEGAAIVAIGCEYGRSSSIILQAAPQHAALYFIDPFLDPLPASKWMEMTRKTGREFTLYCRKSEDVWEHLHFNLIHIDGDHYREGVQTDLAFLDYALPGAYACFHDYGLDSLPEIYPTVVEYMATHPEWFFYKQAASLGVWRKRCS